MSKKNHQGKNKWQEFADKQQAADEAVADAEQAATSQADESSDELGLGYPSREQLENQLTKLEQDLLLQKEAAQRAQAELQNTLRRTERDVSNAHKFGIEKLVNDLIPVLDTLLRAMDNVDLNDPKVASMQEGIQLTLDLMRKNLAKHGVDVIDPKPGDSFNPDYHEAISMQQSDQYPANSVITVVQQGYSLNGRVLRAAMVVVSS